MGQGNKEWGWLKVGLELGKSGWNLAQGIGQLTLQSIEEKMATDVNGIVQNKPLDDARIGMDAIRRGRTQNSPELEFMGEAAVILAAVRAEETPVVPEQNVAYIAGMIAEAGIDPILSPLVADETAQRAEKLLHRNNPVTEIFPNRT